MLNHEDNLDTLAQSAAQVRVTPEELATAASRIEARKDTDQRRADGTIPIGEAVQQLGLAVTPEEVLAEVQAARAQQAGAQKKRPPRRRLARLAGAGLRPKWSVPLLLSLLCLTGFGVYSVTGDTPFDRDQMTPGTAPYNLEPYILSLDPKSVRPTLSTLAEAPSDQTLYCSVGAIEVAAMSRNTQMGTEPQRGISQPIMDINWPVVKHGRDLYVRGWVPVRLSKEAARLAEVEVFNKPDLPQLGPHPQQVTFKLDLHTSFMGLGFQRLRPDGAGEFVFHNPRLTDQTYEKWQQ